MKCINCQKENVIRKYRKIAIQFCDECNLMQYNLQNYNNMIKDLWNSNRRDLGITQNIDEYLQQLKQNTFFEYGLINQQKDIPKKLDQSQKNIVFIKNKVKFIFNYDSKILYFKYEQFDKMVQKLLSIGKQKFYFKRFIKYIKSLFIKE